MMEGSSEPQITIRPAGPEDLPFMAALESKCFSVPWSAHSLASELGSENSVFLIAELDGVPAGYAGMQTTADEGSVFNIAVAGSFRRRGAGRALTRALKSRAEELGLSAVYLEVRLSNIPAVTLYEHEGFAACGLRRGYYSSPKEDAAIMKLALPGCRGAEKPADGFSAPQCPADRN